MVTLIDTAAGVLPSGKVSVPPPPRPSTATEISVDGVVIDAAAIRAELQHHPAETPAAAFEDAARALVVRELLLGEARRKGIDAMPMSLGDGRAETPEDAAIRALLDAEVTTPMADEATCRRHYVSNPEAFRSETIYEARHILIAAPPDDPKARERARDLAEAVAATLADDPEQFSVLAQLHSACPSRRHGGNLGQLTRGSTVPEFEAALMGLAEGRMAPGPVATPYGFHVIRLDRIIRGEPIPFELARERIAAWLEASSWSRAVAQYIAILAGRADIRGISLRAGDGPLVQ